MIRFNRKFIAVLLAIWLPLFGGNALAVSITMQSTSGDCHETHAGVMDAHAGHMMPHDQQHDQQQSSHKGCGVCHVACCTYMATAEVAVAKTALSPKFYDASSTQFQSVPPALLDPPPLALA